MTPWWERWPGRLDAEIESFGRRDLGAFVDEDLRALGKVVIRSEVPVDSEPYAVSVDVHYPTAYPWSRFAVVAPMLDLPRHQHPFGKNLCVFPRGGEHWDRTWLAGDVVADRVPELIRAVRAGGPDLAAAEEPQGEPFTDYFDFFPFGGILVPDVVIDAATDEVGGEFTVKLSGGGRWLHAITDPAAAVRGRTGHGVVTGLHGSGTSALANDDVSSTIHDATTIGGRWVRLETPPRTTNDGQFFEELVQIDPRLEPWSLTWVGRDPSLAIVAGVFSEEFRQNEHADAWIFCVLAKRASGQPPRPNARRQPRPADAVSCSLVRGMRCDATDLAERIPELRPLRGRTVVVAGLGTLGAPIVRHLARGLAGEIRGIDHDHVEAGTAVRWDTGFRAAGVLKTLFLAEDIGVDHPYTRFVPLRGVIGGVAGDDEPSGPEDPVGSYLEGTDLIIDATAHQDATAVLADHAWQLGIPFVTTWSIEGYGGVVARIIPGETGCLHCLELLLSPTHGVIDVPRPPTDPQRVQPEGCADPTFTAAAFDLDPLSDHAARVAAGELCRGVAGGYPRYNADIHLLVLRHPGGELVEPPQWTSISLEVHRECPCHSR